MAAMVQALGSLMDGDGLYCCSASPCMRSRLRCKTDGRDALCQFIVADCLDLLDKRATTPARKPRGRFEQVASLAKVLKKSGVLS